MAMASEHSDKAFPTPTIAAATLIKLPTATKPSPFFLALAAARLWLLVLPPPCELAPLGLGDLAAFSAAAFFSFLI